MPPLTPRPNPDLAGAERALDIVQEALTAVRDRAAAGPGAEEPVLDLAACHRRVAGLLYWKWQLSQSPADLAAAIASYEPALSYTEKARTAGVFRHPGFLASTRLKLMLLLRFRDDNPDRPDLEGHREAILSIAPLEADDLLGVSYLTWYQTITLADAGRGQSSQQLAIEALAADAMLRPNTQYWEVGRRVSNNEALSRAELAGIPKPVTDRNDSAVSAARTTGRGYSLRRSKGDLCHS